MRASVYLL